jgi:endo-1,4-beta-xylanase
MNKLWLMTALLAVSCAGTNPNSRATLGMDTAAPLTLAALPVGGSDVLGADAFAALQGGSSATAKVEKVAVVGQPFAQAWRVTSLSSPSEPYSTQLNALNRAPIKRDDVLLLQFVARSIQGKPARTEFVFEWDGEAYDKSAHVGTDFTGQWTLYSVPFRAHRDFPIGKGALRFRLGYGDHALEIGGVILKNYTRTQTPESLPFAGITYVGRELSAAWRVAADARIDQIRKADLRVKVSDATGKPVPNATVKLEMIRHAFRFGSAVDAGRFLETGPDALKYKKTILELFNHIVLENDLKWPGWECCNRTKALEALRVFKASNITVRGHTLLWGCSEDECYPPDVPSLLANPTALRTRIDRHFVDILGATKGLLSEWDVINEPSAGKRLSGVLGEDEMTTQFRRAKDLVPTARMFVNDNANLGEGNSEVEYKRIIARLLVLKAPLEGIGLQGHFGSNRLTPPAELFTRLTDFGKFGLPLAITEFDVNVNNEPLQADYLRDFMTVAFSSPNVNSFLMWGFWEGQHWIPNAALYRKDWSIKPNGQAYKDLLFKRWWTNATGLSNTNGQYGTRGFLGYYKVTATLGAKTATRIVALTKTSGEFVITLP